MATPRACTDTNCVCPLPNGFSNGGNRVCLRYGPATWTTDSTGKSVSVKNTKPVQPPSPEFCSSCCGHIGQDGKHDCPVLALQKEMLAFMAAECTYQRRRNCECRQSPLCQECVRYFGYDDDDEYDGHTYNCTKCQRDFKNKYWRNQFLCLDCEVPK